MYSHLMTNPKPTTHRHREATRIILRPIGSGLPLGLFALAIGTLLTGSAAFGIIPTSEIQQVGLMLVLFAFPLELLAAILAFMARDTMSATAFALFSASWLSIGMGLRLSEPGSTSAAVGMFELGVALSVAILAVLAAKAKPYITVLMGLSALRLAAHGIYELTSVQAWYTAVGVIAVLIVIGSLYGATAFILEDMHQREVLPLFRKRHAEEAFHGFEHQLDRLEAEPGIRQQL